MNLLRNFSYLGIQTVKNKLRKQPTQSEIKELDVGPARGLWQTVCRGAG